MTAPALPPPEPSCDRDFLREPQSGLLNVSSVVKLCVQLSVHTPTPLVSTAEAKGCASGPSPSAPQGLLTVIHLGPVVLIVRRCRFPVVSGASLMLPSAFSPLSASASFPRTCTSVFPSLFHKACRISSLRPGISPGRFQMWVFFICVLRWGGLCVSSA